MLYKTCLQQIGIPTHKVLIFCVGIILFTQKVYFPTQNLVFASLMLYICTYIFVLITRE